MRVLYQPTLAQPRDWIETTCADWRDCGEFSVQSVNVHGRVFEGFDSISVRPLDGGAVEIVAVHDDPKDWPIGYRWARVSVVRPLTPRADLGNAFSTDVRDTVYADSAIGATLRNAYRDNPRITLEPWLHFERPEAKARNGEWLTDKHFAATQKARALRGWREWTDGVPESCLCPHTGKLADQRRQGRFKRPTGTRTYYHNNDAGSEVHNPANALSLGLSPAGSSNVGSGNVGGNGMTIFEAHSPAGEPDSAAWPAGAGDMYEAQLDVISAGSDLVWGLLDLGSQGIGGFMRLTSAPVEAQRFAQDQAAFAVPGLALASVDGPAWVAGLASDLFGIVIASQRVSGHGNQVLTMQLGEGDDFARGAWAAAGGGGINTFFGVPF